MHLTPGHHHNCIRPRDKDILSNFYFVRTLCVLRYITEDNVLWASSILWLHTENGKTFKKTVWTIPYVTVTITCTLTSGQYRQHFMCQIQAAYYYSMHIFFREVRWYECYSYPHSDHFNWYLGSEHILNKHFFPAKLYESVHHTALVACSPRKEPQKGYACLLLAT